MNPILAIFIFISLIQLRTESYSQDIADDVAAAVKNGNAASTAKFFSATVDLKIIEKEDIYSKAQAELILKDFFTKNPVKSFTILHKGTSKSGSQFAIGSYETTTGEKKFRISFFFKKEDGRLSIHQLRIEE